MNLETVSTKRNRIYRRAFDHELAQELFAQGWSQAKLAERFGVSWVAVDRVVNPARRQQMAEASNRWHRANRKPCKGDCGRLVWSNTSRGSSGFCSGCFGRVKSRTARDGELLCNRCKQWKPDEEFHRATSQKARRQRYHACRPCSTEERREYRHKNRAAS